MIPVNTINKVFWRELAFSHAAADSKRVGRVFVRSVRFFLFLGGCVTAVFVFNADWLVHSILGDKYAGFAPVLSIMAIYPIPFGVLALSTSYFNATDQFKIVHDTSFLFFILGIPLTYFFVAPGDAIVAGLDLGAQGLALREFIVGGSVAALQVFIIFRQLQVSYARAFLGQIGVVVCLLFAMYAAKTIVTMLGLCGTPTFVLELALFSVVVGPIVYWRPELSGLSKSQRDEAVARLLTMARLRQR